MSHERYVELVGALCEATGLHDPEQVLSTNRLEVAGFNVNVSWLEFDPESMYLQFEMGIVTAGRTSRVFRMLLEANLLVYAQDQAQMGVDPDTGGILLIMRVPMADDIDGPWLAETLIHYVDHGTYWRDNLGQASDEMFEGIATGNYVWLKA